MGSLSKRLGQITALSLESESSQILRTIKPNKIPNSLSQRLDTTLKDSHDMKTFGLGTLASMANKERYVRFTKSLYGVYSTMEDELDRCAKTSFKSTSDGSDGSQENVNRIEIDGDVSNLSEALKDQQSPVAYFWNRHSEILRRSELLQKDILAVSADEKLGDEASYSKATLEYMQAIREAGNKDRKDGSGRLLGHAYTRYLADLMGGSVLATPTRLALRLEEGTPEQYTFSFPAENDRKGYVGMIYSDLNESGKLMNDDDSKLEEVVEEARLAFRHNIAVYGEEPIILDSFRGLKCMASGYFFHK